MMTRWTPGRWAHRPTMMPLGRCPSDGDATCRAVPAATRHSLSRAILRGVLVVASGLGGPSLSAAAAGTCAEARNERALLACREKDFEKVETEVAQLVAALHKSYLDDGPDRVALFTKAQSAWKLFRDAECKSLSYESQGPAYKAYLLSCMAEMTRSRAAAIRNLKANP